jgi:hypothetical protein
LSVYYTIEVLGVKESNGQSSDGRVVAAEGTTAANIGSASNPITLPAIEKLQKAFKTHRNALDFDKGFVTALSKS